MKVEAYKQNGIYRHRNLIDAFNFTVEELSKLLPNNKNNYE